ncbi:hypothetical protein [Novosphingobium album (ex Liu et al. 2023)]|uniref:DUF3168 domain-containing protein n=1 Tax=Novosphingobium album (ex Liu et al. 2023) TaxID=3031130 RepID=A0ABT5WSA6_9SPHN|nr:hypothetical protein [Novosphingobium album (ex Liu et al. 2023)]MDE8651883.1 hypothetical protein [Novosphingobium album (ex Liu et al. 2023)]
MPMEEALVGRLQGAPDVALYAGVQYSWFGFNRGESGLRVALRLISAGEEWTHDGPDGLNEPRVRFDVEGEDAVQVMALARAIICEMHRPADVEGVIFHPAQLAADRTFDAEELGGGVARLRRQLEFLFFYEEK